MKKKILTISLVFMFFAVSPIFSQTLPPGPGSTGDQSGGGAPLGEGLFVLLGLGAAYAGKKIYQYWSKGSQD